MTYLELKTICWAVARRQYSHYDDGDDNEPGHHHGYGNDDNIPRAVVISILILFRRRGIDRVRYTNPMVGLFWSEENVNGKGSCSISFLRVQKRKKSSDEQFR